MSLYWSNTASNSFFLNKPLFTKIQCRLSPIALFKSTAATVESTPPESPNITLSDLSSDLKYETVWSINESGDQSWFNFEIFKRKFSKTFLPSLEWYTSGWNWSP